MINVDMKRVQRVPATTNTIGLIVCYLITGSTLVMTSYAFVKFFVG